MFTSLAVFINQSVSEKPNGFFNIDAVLATNYVIALMTDILVIASFIQKLI